MSFNLIDSVKNIFSNELTGKASALIGENESSVKTALIGIIPAVLTGLLAKAGSGDPQNILSMVKDASNSGMLGNLTSAFGNSGMLANGGDMLKSLFGDKLGSVSSLISGFSGIKESSASSLMSIAGPAALGVLGKHASENNMNAGGLLSFLNTQKDSILNAVPSGLNLAGALGLGSLAGIGSKLSGKVSEFTTAYPSGAKNITHTTELKPVGNRWLPLVLGAIIVIGLIIFLTKGCGASSKPEAMVSGETVRTDTMATQPTETVRESLKVKLPNGVELDAYKGGVEDQLVTFLNNPVSVPGKNIWFDFDNLNFKTGSSDLTEESLAQVKNIDAILKAYPKVKIKIGGYTDKVGDSLNNIKLSKSRADAVVAALMLSGAAKSQVLGAEGYGAQYANVAADASDADRQKDRRIAVSVRAK